MTARPTGGRRSPCAGSTCATADPATSRDRDALFRRGAVPDPAVREAARAILADVRDARRRGGPRRRRALRRRPARRPARPRRRDELRRRARDALPVRASDALETGDRATSAGSPSAQRPRLDPDDDRRGHRDRAPLAAARPRRRLRARRLGAVPDVARHDRRAGARRRRRRRSSSRARPDRTANVDPVLLGAAGLLEVDALLVAGGAQAIGALAYGLPERASRPSTGSSGPGNAWVTAAKLEVVGEVGIDLPAGPSEGMVLADASADPRARRRRPRHPGRARPRLAGAPRHDRRRVRRCRRGARSRRCSPPRRAARSSSARSATTAGSCSRPTSTPRIDFVNAYAPEHLSIDVDDLEAAVARVRNAGSIFVGPWAPESAGDYATGANHVLPDRRPRARLRPRSAVEAFGKFIQVQRITRDGLATHPRDRRAPSPRPRGCTPTATPSRSASDDARAAA